MGKAIFCGHERYRKPNNERDLYLAPYTFECFDFHLGSHWRNPILGLEIVLMVNLEKGNLSTEVKVCKNLSNSFFFSFLFFGGGRSGKAVCGSKFHHEQ